MYTLDKEKTKVILTEELGYDPGEADFYLDHYPPLHDQLEEAVKRWFDDRTVIDVAIEGITIQEVMHSQSTHFLNAVSSLNDFLTRDFDIYQKEAFKQFLLTPLVRR